MRDVRLLELLERQWNRASLAQLQALGFTRAQVNERVSKGRLRAVHQGVFGEAAWSAAGWIVHRVDASAVYEHPERLLTLAPAT